MNEGVVMLKRISVFALFSGLVSLSVIGCGKNDLGSTQLSNQGKNQTSKEELAEMHKNVNFEDEEMARIHGVSNSRGGGGHGMGIVHGNKEKADPDKVIASVNEEKILRKDLDKILNRFKNHVDPASIHSLERQITDQLVTQAVLRQFVEEKGLKVPDDVVEKEINNMRENIKNNPNAKGKTLEQFLELQGSNIDELKTAIRMSAALEKYVSQNITDEVLEKYFIEHIDEFSGETVTASHILIDTKGMESQEELDRARAKIESIKKELDDGADFSELAKKYSDCPTGKRGGNLGSFSRHGVMVEPFANAAFATEVGTVSDPVKTKFGYHLIYVTEHTPKKDVSFQEVKDEVREKLEGREMNKMIKDLKASAQIEIKL